MESNNTAILRDDEKTMFLRCLCSADTEVGTKLVFGFCVVGVYTTTMEREVIRVSRLQQRDGELSISVRNSM